MKISFWGSSNFSLEILKALHQKHNEKKVELSYVISQSSKPFGRKKELKHNPIVEYCIENNLTLYTPEKLKDLFPKENIDNSRLTTDLSFVAAYGKIIPEHILLTAKYGFVNFHGSLLPQYRGAIPVQMTILNQENVGGITLIKMDKGMDTGEIITSYELRITSEMTSGELMEKLAILSAEKVREDFDLIFNPEKWDLKKQNDLEATTCFVQDMDKKNFEINYLDGIKRAHGKIMAANPEPKAWIDTKAMNLRMPFLKINIVRSKLNSENIEIIELRDRMRFHIDQTAKRLFIELTDGFVEVLELQPEGKKVMDVRSFLNGYGGMLERD